MPPLAGEGGYKAMDIPHTRPGRSKFSRSPDRKVIKSLARIAGAVDDLASFAEV
jgi:hypothetical protein